MSDIQNLGDLYGIDDEAFTKILEQFYGNQGPGNQQCDPPNPSNGAGACDFNPPPATEVQQQLVEQQMLKQEPLEQTLQQYLSEQQPLGQSLQQYLSEQQPLGETLQQYLSEQQSLEQTLQQQPLEQHSMQQLMQHQVSLQQAVQQQPLQQLPLQQHVSLQQLQFNRTPFMVQQEQSPCLQQEQSPCLQQEQSPCQQQRQQQRVRYVYNPYIPQQPLNPPLTPPSTATVRAVPTASSSSTSIAATENNNGQFYAQQAFEPHHYQQNQPIQYVYNPCIKQQPSMAPLTPPSTATIQAVPTAGSSSTAAGPAQNNNGQFYVQQAFQPHYYQQNQPVQYVYNPCITQQQSMAPLTPPSSDTVQAVPSASSSSTSIGATENNNGQVYVRKACEACKASHVACDVERPCSRCLRLKKGDTCVDAVRKKRGRPTRDDPRSQARRNGSAVA